MIIRMRGGRAIETGNAARNRAGHPSRLYLCVLVPLREALECLSHGKRVPCSEPADTFNHKRATNKPETFLSALKPKRPLSPQPFFQPIQRTDQRLLVGGDPSPEGPGGGRFGGDEMVREVVLEQIPVQRAVEFGQRRVIRCVGRNGGDEAVAAFGAVDQPTSRDGIAGGAHVVEDRFTENRPTVGGGFIHIEAGRNVLNRQCLAPRHTGVGFVQVDRQAVRAGKLVQQEFGQELAGTGKS